MRGNQIRLEGYLSSDFIRLDKLGQIHHFKEDELCIYYAVNEYTNDYSGRRGVHIYSFLVEKETKCYYFIRNKQRIDKKFRSSTWAATPEDAVTKSMQRAHRYYQIMIDRAQNVSHFLKETMHVHNAHIHDVLAFEEIARSMDPDLIPAIMFKDKRSIDDILERLNG